MAKAVDNDGFIEAGTKKPKENIGKSVPIANTNPYDDPRYAALMSELQGYHRDLLGKKLKLAENPVECGQYLDKIRPSTNQLFIYMNSYIDDQIEQSTTVAVNRQNLYEQQLVIGKSPNAAEKHASEMTRIDSANLKVIELRIQQIKNDYERFNGLCMWLQSRMKEFNTERIMG